MKHSEIPVTSPDQGKKHEITVRRRIGTAGLIAGVLVGAGATEAINLGIQAHEQQVVAGHKWSDETLTVQSGQGWFDFADELQADPHDTNARNHSRQDVETELMDVNPDLTKPGYVLKPGDTVHVPVDLAPPSHK